MNYPQKQQQQHKFEVLELIGRGSFGNVRKVQRISDGRLCVRKEISYIHMNPKERSQLIDEFRILGSLNNPNIVEYIHHEHVPEDHMVYLYMEYCDGGDLSQIIKSHKKNKEYVPEDLIWGIFTQLIMALYRCHYGVDPPELKDIFQNNYEEGENEESGNDDYEYDSNDSDSNPRKAHMRGMHQKHNNNNYKYSTSSNSEPTVVNNEMIIIHRDIKPDNVFLLKDNIVKLGDFGLAKLLLSESQFATTYVGTPYYMSPEVLMDKPYTPLSDIWSLGCVMYELCALHPPFQAKSHVALQNKIKEGKFPPIPKHYSQKLRLTINACIMVDCDQRPSSYLLLQEISIKIFRKELELQAKQQSLNIMERNLKRQESLLIQEQKRMDEEISQELSFQKKMIENELEEIRLQYKNEFQYVVEQEVSNRIKLLLQLPQFMQQIIEQVSITNKLHRNGSNSTPSLPIADLSMLSLGSASPSNIKLKGPREVYDHLLATPLQRLPKTNTSSNNVLKQVNSNNSSTNNVSQDFIYDYAPSSPTKYYNKKASRSSNDENYLLPTNPNVYGAVTGSQNLNMNGTNVLNKATHNANSHVLSKKKKYYNELYEENTPSPFLRTFNTDL